MIEGCFCLEKRKHVPHHGEMCVSREIRTANSLSFAFQFPSQTAITFVAGVLCSSPRSVK